MDHILNNVICVLADPRFRGKTEGPHFSCQLSDAHDCLFLSVFMSRKWCRHEVEKARAYGMPIICVVDIDKQTQREVIDHWMEKGLGWLFHEQVSAVISPHSLR